MFSKQRQILAPIVFLLIALLASSQASSLVLPPAPSGTVTAAEDGLHIRTPLDASGNYKSMTDPKGSAPTIVITSLDAGAGEVYLTKGTAPTVNYYGSFRSYFYAQQIESTSGPKIGRPAYLNPGTVESGWFINRPGGYAWDAVCGTTGWNSSSAYRFLSPANTGPIETWGALAAGADKQVNTLIGTCTTGRDGTWGLISTPILALGGANINSGEGGYILSAGPYTFNLNQLAVPVLYRCNNDTPCVHSCPPGLQKTGSASCHGVVQGPDNLTIQVLSVASAQSSNSQNLKIPLHSNSSSASAKTIHLTYGQNSWVHSPIALSLDCPHTINPNACDIGGARGHSALSVAYLTPDGKHPTYAPLIPDSAKLYPLEYSGSDASRPVNLRLQVLAANNEKYAPGAMATGTLTVTAHMGF